MKIFDYEIKNRLLALTGLLIIISLVFIPDKYGFATRVFCAVLGFICVGISTGNKKFISEAKALFIIVIIIIVLLICIAIAVFITPCCLLL